jgi:hypothetical protein
MRGCLLFSVHVKQLLRAWIIVENVNRMIKEDMVESFALYVAMPLAINIY